MFNIPAQEDKKTPKPTNELFTYILLKEEKNVKEKQVKPKQRMGFLLVRKTVS